MYASLRLQGLMYRTICFQIDKAQQRIRQGQRSSMYTADASIDAKVKGASGWRELLKLLGFRFQKASNGIPDSVFFPTVTSEVGEKLAAASNHLHALLGKVVISAGKVSCETTVRLFSNRATIPNPFSDISAHHSIVVRG